MIDGMMFSRAAKKAHVGGRHVRERAGADGEGKCMPCPHPWAVSRFSPPAADHGLPARAAAAARGQGGGGGSQSGGPRHQGVALLRRRGPQTRRQGVMVWGWHWWWEAARPLPLMRHLSCASPSARPRDHLPLAELRAARRPRDPRGPRAIHGSGEQAICM